MIDKLDLHYNGDNSKIAKEQEKIRKRKQQRKRKSEKKLNGSVDTRIGLQNYVLDNNDDGTLTFEEQLLLKSRLG